MPLPREPKYEFFVYYKKHPFYRGAFNADIKAGIHGCFDNIGDAERQAENCERWFKVQKEAVQIEGKSRPDIKETIHDNVVVWIEAYKDGAKIELPAECKWAAEEETDKEKPKKKELAKV